MYQETPQTKAQRKKKFRNISELLAVFDQSQVRTSHDRAMQQHMPIQQVCSKKYEHTQFHSGKGTQTQTDCAYTFLSLNPVTFGVVPNLASPCTCYID